MVSQIPYQFEGDRGRKLPILARYISGELVKMLLLSVCAFIAIYLVVDVFQGIRMIMDHKPAVQLIFKLYLLKVPNIVSQVIPVVVLLSTIITLGLLSKNSEVVAMKSSGISLYSIVFPVLVISIAVSFLSFFSNEYILPYTNRMVKFIERVDIRKETPKRLFKQDKIWYRSENAIYNIQFFNPETNTLKGIVIYYIGDGFKLTKRLEAREAKWDGTAWIFYDAIENVFNNDGITGNSYKKITVKLPESPDVLKTEERVAEEMGFRELKAYIKRLKGEGYDSSRLVVDLYSKLSYPFTSFIMAFLGIPFALKSGRSGGFALGVFISVLIGFGYWLVMSISLSLGRVEALPPLIAAWGANVIFGLIGVLMMMKAEGD